jgi:hypothetical protein
VLPLRVVAATIVSRLALASSASCTSVGPEEFEEFDESTASFAQSGSSSGRS